MNFLQKSSILSLKFGILIQANVSRAPRLIMLSNTRTFLSRKKLPKIERIEKKYKLKDSMPSTTTLIYNNPSAFWIGPFFHFQNLCIIVISVYLIHFFQRYLNNNIEFPFVYEGNIIIRNEKEVFSFIGILIIMLIASSLACKLTAFRVYFDHTGKMYKAVLVGYLPFVKRVINIEPKSVTPVVRRFLSKEFRTFEYEVDGKKMFLHDEYFKRPEDFNRMLKYYY